MKEDGNQVSAFRTGLVLTIALMIGITYFVPALSLANDIGEDPRVWVDGDFVVSYDESEIPGTSAFHPAVATTPTNEVTLGNRFAGGIHAVWDEMDETTGDREIHYSMTYPEMSGYPLEWTNDEKSEDDRIVSEERKGKAVMGDAVDPSIAVDSQGIIHVVWAQEYIDSGFSTWEVHYARSVDNGKFWSSETGQVPGVDIPVSRYYGDRESDAEVMPGGPKIAISYDNTIQKAAEVLQVVWPEYTQKDGQEILHSYSVNGGNSWSGVEVNNVISNPSTSEFAWDPCIGTSGDFGEFVHVAWRQLMSGKAPTEEIFYTRSDDQGGSWQGEELTISDPGIPGIIDSVSMATGRYEVHVAWAQEESGGKAPASGVFYQVSFNDGDNWEYKENMISNPGDGNLAKDVGVAVARFTGKAPLEVQVVWSERDDTSPAGTWEVHNSMTETPVEPTGWTGQQQDIVLSWPDEDPTANVNNVSVAMTFWNGEWEPRIVWDETNVSKGKGYGRANQNTEVHFDPPAVEYTLSTSTVGSGSITKNPNLPTYPDGTFVTLTANPSAGWSFDHWSGDLSGSTNPDMILMDGDKSVTVHFTQDQYTLSISIVGSGSVSKNPNQATYTYGQVVTLTANPSLGWSFDSWSGALSGSANPETITMWGNRAVTATFTQDQYTLSTSAIGSGGVAKNPNQATYTYGQVVTLTANPSGGWSFDHWSGDLSGSTNPDTITMDGDKSVTAHFTQDQYTLSISIVGSGSVTKNPDQSTYTYNTFVDLTAIPNAGWSFDQWSGDMTGSTNPDTIIMNSNKAVTATFTQDQYTLSTSVVGSGSIVKNPNQPTYTYGQVVTLTANPSVGWHFDHWSGDLTGSTNPDTITIYGNSAVTAHFIQDQYTLTVTVVGSGSVVKNPNQPTYTYGTPVQLTANPTAGWSFDSWSGDLGGSTNPDTIIMNGNRAVTATFTQDQYTLSISTVGSGSVVKNPNQPTYTYGTVVQLTANPIAGWSFDHWSGGMSGSTNPDTITIWGDSSVTAHFTQDMYTLSVFTAGSGSVIKNPNQPTYTYGTPVQLTANPSVGWEFDYWSGDLTGSTNPDTITIYGDSSVTAHFVQISHDITLIAGWNLVSVPLIQADTTLSTVLWSINGQYDMVQYYDGFTDQWKTYATFKPTILNDLTDIDHTMGFWLHTTSACTLTVYGQYPSSTVIPLYAGTNMVGYPTQDTSTTVAAAFAGTGYDKVEVCDLGEPYNLREVAGSYIMQPGEGYLVHVPADTTWTVDW